MKIAVTSNSFSQSLFLRQTLQEKLGDKYQFQYNDTGTTLLGDKLKLFLSDADAAIVGLEKLDEDVFQSTNLKFITKYGVGIDNIDLSAMKKKGVKLKYTTGVNAYAVAEHALGMMINLSRRISENSNLVKAGTWIKEGGREIREMNIGIIGFGNVGRELARMLSCLGAHVFTNDLRDIGTHHSKEEIYEKCDIISLHVPLTPLTKYMLADTAFSQMKKKPIIINTSRGLVISERALIKALDDGLVRSAGLDVFEDEPTKLNHPNILATPHTAGNSTRAVYDMGMSAIKNLKDLLS